MPPPPSSRTFRNRHKIWASQNLCGAQNFGRLVEPMVHTKNDQLPCPVHEKLPSTKIRYVLQLGYSVEESAWERGSIIIFGIEMHTDPI